MGSILAPTPESIARAAEVLRAGGVVGMPTETVYGLGADAENPAAVARIFELKGRPADHPLIVHIGEPAALAAWGREIPQLAYDFAESFWPGPLTMIVKRDPRVPLAVTGGLETVGLRVPGHPVALALLKEFGGGVAAPSANKFGAVSPTTARHVSDAFGGALGAILDGGACAVGIESTIVDLSSGPPEVLRPGGVTREMLEAVAKMPVPLRQGGAVRAPGMLESHYAPRATVEIVAADAFVGRAAALMGKGKRVLVLANVAALIGVGKDVLRVELPEALEDVARGLYSALREADRQHADVILVALPPEEGLGLAIADRLRRAAGRRE